MEELRTYFVGQPITLRGWFLLGATIGSITKNQTRLEVQDETGLTLTNGAPIFVEGAGALGGDLVTTVSAHPSTGVVTLAASALTDANRRLVGTPHSPTTVTIKVKKPDGSEATVTASEAATGRFEGSYTPATDGDFFWRMTGSGGMTGDAWRKFIVAPERVP